VNVGCIRHPGCVAARSDAMRVRDLSPHQIPDQRSSVSRCSASGMTFASLRRETAGGVRHFQFHYTTARAPA